MNVDAVFTGGFDSLVPSASDPTLLQGSLSELAYIQQAPALMTKSVNDLS